QEAGIAAAMVALAGLGTAFLPVGWSVLIALAASALWSGATIHAFAAGALWPAAGPLLGIWLAWVGQVAVRSVEERNLRLWIESVFGQHVSRAVVEKGIRDPRAFALGGARRDLTVLFSDIRGFTSMSEEMEPEQVVERLNEYLPEM